MSVYAMAGDDGGDRESWEEFHHEIDRRLDDLRPARAASRERDWRQPVYAWARNHMPNETTIIRHLAQQEVDRREGQATKRGNQFVRDWAKGIAPLGWSLVGPLPIVVSGLRIRLDVATTEDVEDAAYELLTKGKTVYDEVVVLGNALRKLGHDARQAGYAYVAQLGDLPPAQR